MKPTAGYVVAKESDHNAIWKYGVTDDYQGKFGTPSFTLGRYAPSKWAEMTAAARAHPEFRLAENDRLVMIPIFAPGLRRNTLVWETNIIREHSQRNGGNRPPGNKEDG